MKHEKRLQRWMKDLLVSKRLNPDNWLYISKKPDVLVIRHRCTGSVRTIDRRDL